MYLQLEREAQSGDQMLASRGLHLSTKWKMKAELTGTQSVSLVVSPLFAGARRWRAVRRERSVDVRVGKALRILLRVLLEGRGTRLRRFSQGSAVALRLRVQLLSNIQSARLRSKIFYLFRWAS